MPRKQHRRGKVLIKESGEIFRKISLIVGETLPVYYEYNNRIKHLGLYLKPIHMVTRKSADGSIVKYYYYGRYWYKIEKTPDGRIRWIYIGKEKPVPTLPDPPANPLEGVVVKVHDDNVEIVFANEEILKRLYERIFSRKSSD